MKKFSEFRDKLTLKRAKNYTLIITLIFTLTLAILLTSLMWSDFEIKSILILLLPTPLLSVLVYILLAEYIFRVPDKEWDEQHLTAKKKFNSSLNLTTDNYIKVRYNYEKALWKTNGRKMLSNLLVNSNFSFYIKLNGEEEIELIVKDKDENILYTDTITNFIYLEEYFEIIT